MTRELVAVVAALALACGGVDPATLPPCSTPSAVNALVTPRPMPDLAECCRQPDGTAWPESC